MRLAAHSLAALSAVAAAPVAAGLLAVRPGWRVGLRERLGVAGPLRPGAIWIHGASVGEILAASRLVDCLLKNGHQVVTSTVTLTGREAMRRTHPEIPCRLAPLDHPWCVDAALRRARPAALVLIETELWPAWIAGAARHGVPVALVSGRVSDRSYPRYRRLGFVVRPTLRRMAAVGARTPEDRDRLLALGALPGTVSVTGDLKLERDEAPRPLAPDLAALLGEVPLIVAGSTHGGEEVAALAALDEAERQGVAAALVLAPRWPARAGVVARIVRGAGRRLRRRTAPGPDPLRPGEVLLLDTLGELAPIYGRADVAFVGGSLVPRGGHNVLEPVFAGRPVLFGPHVANVRHAAELLEACGAGRRVPDTQALARVAAQWLREPAATRRRGEAGRAALASHRGTASRVAALVESVLEPGPGR